MQVFQSANNALNQMLRTSRYMYPRVAKILSRLTTIRLSLGAKSPDAINSVPLARCTDENYLALLNTRERFLKEHKLPIY